MLSVFPDLLSFAILAPFIIRIFLGGYFLLSGLYTLRGIYAKEKTFFLPACAIPIMSVIGGALVLLGLYTQPAAILLALLSIYMARDSKNRITFLLLTGMALSLLFTGAGAFAFDLPL
ncbi:MAG: DoxX family membrane protein [Parcubacteria group bacterium]|nr:DoxX family membrane protein [Parcubacteria group bacterium]